MYTLRYVEGTQLKDRLHVHTLVRCVDWRDAEAARERCPRPELLEVVERGGRS